MKSLSLLFVLFFSTQAFARQYIQCGSLDLDTTDVMVINLETAQGGTIFLSSGMQNPEDERVIMNIAFSKIENGNHIYNIQSDINGAVLIPSQIIGKPGSRIGIDLYANGMYYGYTCFARIYND